MRKTPASHHPARTQKNVGKTPTPHSRSLVHSAARMKEDWESAARPGERRAGGQTKQVEHARRLAGIRIGVVQNYVNAEEFDQRVAAGKIQVDSAVSDELNLRKLRGGLRPSRGGSKRTQLPSRQLAGPHTGIHVQDDFCSKTGLRISVQKFIGCSKEKFGSLPF